MGNGSMQEGERRMDELSGLPNVGKVLEEHLLGVGVDTPAQLRQLGSRAVFRRIRLQRDPDACLHMLYGLQGAVEGIPDKFLTQETKEALKLYYKSLEAAGKP